MAHSNATPNYNLPQWVGTDKPTFLGDFNSAFSAIDTGMKSNADASTSAVQTANTADGNATNALQNANTAVNTANTAKNTADDAILLARQAKNQSAQAEGKADTALIASAANTIENLAPAYDPTLTYAVGDLVTYIDSENSGKLYKCIVPVATPMAFNINYWDDVTTSEVYRLKRKLIASGTVESTDTYSDFLTALTSGLALTPNRDYKLVITFASGAQGFYNVVEYDAATNYIKFSRSSGTASGAGTLTTLSHDPTETDTAYMYAFRTDETVHYTNLMSTAVPFASYALYEI
jgi:hypothetical protein